METIDYLGETLHKWTIGPSTFLACPEKGARLMNWNLSYSDGTVRDLIYWPETDNLKNFSRIRGGNPILFPFCGRTYAGGEEGWWIGPDGSRHPMPRHGFARQGAFELVSLNEHGFGARLVPDAEARQAYPFRYEFSVIYRFEATTLYAELHLKNRDKVPIPWSAGHHFYFTVPWLEGTTRADYRVRIPAKEALRHAADGSLATLPAPPRECPLDSPDLVDRIHTRLRKNTVTIAEKNTGDSLALRVGDDDRAPDPGLAVVTWTESEDSPYYCVEPWMGPPNSPDHNIGLHWVEPGKTAYFLVEAAVVTEQP